jgi:hypothetical protein
LNDDGSVIILLWHDISLKNSFRVCKDNCTLVLNQAHDFQSTQGNARISTHLQRRLWIDVICELRSPTVLIQVESHVNHCVKENGWAPQAFLVLCMKGKYLPLLEFEHRNPIVQNVA